MKRIWALTVPCVMTFAAIAQDTGKPNPPDSKDRPPPTKQVDKQPVDKQPGIAAEQPGAEHKNLGAFIGTWQIKGQCWAESTEPKQVSGAATSEWVLGNRFVQSHVRMNEGDQPVEGIAMCGYDNSQKKFTTTWQDSRCTSIKMETGDYDQATKTFTYKGDFKNKDGKAVQCRRTVKINSETEHVMTTYMTESGQAEKKVAEMTFTRTGERSAR